MTQTSMRYADFVSRANRAHLHILVNNQWTPALKRDADAQAPAGGVSSNVRDLVQWLILELAYKNQFDESYTVPRKGQIEKYANPPVPNVPAAEKTSASKAASL